MSKMVTTDGTLKINDVNGSVAVDITGDVAISGSLSYSQSVNHHNGTSYIASLGDSIIVMTNNNPNSLTIPSNSSVPFKIGTNLEIWQGGSGQTSITAATGVTILYPSSRSLKLLEQHSACNLRKIDTNTWRITGDLEEAAPLEYQWINLLDILGASISTVWNGGSADEEKDITNDGSTFTAPGAYSIAPSTGRCLEFTVGSNYIYSGRMRLVLVSNTYSSPYDQYIAYESSEPQFSGNTIPTGTYDYEPESTPTLTESGGTVTLAVGVGDGGFSGGEATFQIFVEVLS